MSGIQLRCKVFPGAFLLYFCKPRFSIDGSPEQIIRWGETSIPLPPGRHSLRVWYRYITGPTNVADAVVDVPPEGLQMVYKTRWNVFLPGKLELVGGPAAGAGVGAYGAPGGYGPAGSYGHTGGPALQPGQGPAPGSVPTAGPRPAAMAGAGPAPGPGAGPGPAAPPAGWNPDPRGRHQHRWWDGARWTSSVADNGVTTDDPL